MKTQKNNRRKHKNSQGEFSSTAGWLTKRLDDNQRRYNALRIGYLLRETDPRVNPEKVQEDMRLLQITFEGLSQEFDLAKKHGQFAPETNNQFPSPGLTCRMLAAEIDNYLPV